MFALLVLLVAQNDSQRSRAHALITQLPEAPVAWKVVDFKAIKAEC